MPICGLLLATGMLLALPFPPSEGVLCLLNDEFDIVETMVPLLNRISIRELLYTQPYPTGHANLFMWDFRCMSITQSLKSNTLWFQILDQEGNHYLPIRVTRFFSEAYCSISLWKKSKYKKWMKCAYKNWNESSEWSAMKNKLNWITGKKNNLDAIIFTHKFPVAPCVLGR